MKTAELQLLKQVTDLRFRAEQDRFRAICDEENRLRALLAGLDQREKQGRCDLAGDPAMRLIGKDVAWMKWADQHRRRLMAQLANTLARKEQAFSAFQSAYGKDAVLENLVQKSQEAHRAQVALREVEQIEDDLVQRWT